MEANDILDRWESEAAPAVLATVIGIEGHAYRKPGAMMLLYADGRRAGTISPGCLESDLQERTSGLLTEGRCEIVRYNMKPDEDAMWGEAVGCGGVVDVLLEPLAEEAANALRETAARLRGGMGVLLRRFRHGAGISYAVETVEFDAAAPGRSSRRTDSSASLLFAQILRPRPRLLLFGAGYDAEPVARVARALGFKVTVADWRPHLLSGARFPGAELVCGEPSEAAVALAAGPMDYALVMGHQLQKDRALIEALLPAKPAYIGVIGSFRRIAHLFDGLPMPNFVRAPVGLSIGAEGPEEIAISIGAELVAIRRRSERGEAHEGYEYRGHLYGGGEQREDGPAEAVPGVCGWRDAWR
ncbi:XdhC family protein [Cohnella sp. JJ-181]|uniref:XdhC family protein n=1 Tax=Cohnella rhizoplanae TaxID=2974897 RepID=UPI0022FFB06A|nr:XdhC/CoxI family protein [Cohnella sp. JJ-181]CAI6025494.1 putative xanthine dehydrogenase subunit A [Cohnella sp. JJ-181]